MTPKYGHFESNPARFTDTEAWVCQHDNVWRQMNAGEASCRPCRRARFVRRLPRNASTS